MISRKQSKKYMIDYDKPSRIEVLEDEVIKIW